MADAHLLTILRHGQSVWNLEDRLTGSRDVDLSASGIREAHEAGRRLKQHGCVFDVAFVSALRRARHTLEVVLDAIGQPTITRHGDRDLNERDYGELTGLTRDEARHRWGKEQLQRWRRSFDERPPGGESLRDTGGRVWPYYLTRILPEVLRGRRVLVCAHGNSLRCLMKVIECVSDADIDKLTIATGVPVLYCINTDTTMLSKQVLLA